MTFTKGQSGNPTGRPRGVSMASVLGRMLKEKGEDGRPKHDAIARWVIDRALTAEDDTDRWNAINWIWEKIDGPAERTGYGEEGVARYRIDRFVAEIPHNRGIATANGHTHGAAHALIDGDGRALDDPDGA